MILDLINLKKQYQSMSRSDLTTLKAVGVAMTRWLEEMMGDVIGKSHTTAMILDPRHKNQLRFLIDEEKFQKVGF